MIDKITILSHSVSVMAKTWNADGTVTGYGDAKYFRKREVEVASLEALAQLLEEVQDEPTSVVIRGKYVGDKLARDRDGTEFKPGRVRRSLDYYDDQPLHALLLDLDKWIPLAYNPITHPQEAIDEYLQTELPDAFAGAGYWWQLSNSHGHPSKGETLNAHVWMWSKEAYTSAQLKAHVEEVGLNTDKTLMNPVQAHYTALPVFDDCDDPLELMGVKRSGFVPGLIADELDLRLSDAARGAAAGSGGARAQHLRDVAGKDLVAQTLESKGMVRSYARDGSLNIICPFVDEHGSGAGAETSTQYFLPNTGGHALGQFKCLHDSCVGAGRKRGEFIARLGIDENATLGQDFDAVDDGNDAVDDEDCGASGSAAASGGSSGGGSGSGKAAAAKARAIPIAKHLCTDLANANRVLKHFGKKIMVVADAWYTWSGKHWVREDSDVYRNTCRLSEILHNEEAQWRAKPYKDDVEKLLNISVADALKKFAVKCEDKGKIEAAIGLLKKMITVDAAGLNTSEWDLNCMNGTVDLRTGRIRPHNPADRITRLIEIEYDPSAKSEVWDATVAKITLEHDMGPTKPIAGFLKRWFGYCATGSVREHKMPIFWGQGSNGKSTLIDTVAGVLGDYATTAAPGLVMASKSDKHPTEIAALFGRRMVTVSETGEGGTLKEDFVKQATGGDMLTARFMREDFFTFKPTHKLQMMTNHKPAIKGQDNGIWRRLLLVAFVARFGPPEEMASGRAQHLKDTRTAEYLQAETQGILTWIVEGAVDWYRDGLQEPDSVLAQSKDYQGEQDRVLQFVEECCQMDKDAEAPLTGNFGLYESYRDWCKEGGFMPMASQRFQGELERAVPWFRVIDLPRGRAGGDRRRKKLCRGLALLDQE